LKAKVIISIFFVIATIAVGIGLMWSKNISNEREISAYLSVEEPVYVFYRTAECKPEDLDWSIKNLRLLDLFSDLLAGPYWKSVIAQKIGSDSFVLIFEQSREFRDVQLDSLCMRLGINSKREFLSVQDLDGVWNIKMVGNYCVFSNAQDMIQRADLNTNFDQQFKQRDRNASFTFMHGDEVQEFYCMSEGVRAYFNFQFPELQVNTMGASDLSYYNLLPKSVAYFEFLEKDLLTALEPRWSESPLLEYCEHGVIFSAHNNIAFYVMPISDLFSAKDLLESMAGGAQFENIQIKELVGVVPNETKIYAIALENSLVLSVSQSVLEDVALSYQMQTGFNTTKKFENMLRNSALTVHYRWYNRNQLLKSNVVSRLPVEVYYGYSYFRNRDKIMRSVSHGGDASPASPVDVSAQTAQVVWNFSLKNMSSSFHLNLNPVVGIFNPADRAFSVVDAEKNILTSITLSEGLKTIHPLDKGFMIETFEKLYWIPEQNREAQKEFSFKGKIQSSIATYVWNNEEFVTFISEQKMHKLSLKTGKIETLKIPVNLANDLPQLHAFNHKGKLHIGYFGGNEFHAVEVAKNLWFKESLKGKITFSQKIDGKIHVLESIDGKGVHRILFGAEQQLFNNIKPNVAGVFSNQGELIWLLKNENDVMVYFPKSINGPLLTLPQSQFDFLAPVIDGNRVLGVLALNDVQNEITFYKRNGNDRDLVKAQTFRGSKFIRFTGNRRCITFVDGQLVMYEF
jgi:hypothetical protein